MNVSEGDLLWTPNPTEIAGSKVVHYMSWLRARGIADCSTYDELWKWSVDQHEAFWASLWDYFEILSDTPYTCVVDSQDFKPGLRWFPGSKVNFAEHVLRAERAGEVALYSLSETRRLTSIGWSEFTASVRILATRMRAMGVKPGDPVCCLLPNTPEAMIAMLASVSIGAVWSNAAPEFGVNTILDRFKQIKPKWLFVCDGYQYAGKPISKSAEVTQIIEALQPALRQVVFLPYLNVEATAPVGAVVMQDLLDGEDPGKDQFKFERVAHDHPLWVLFSSGTTGLPKGIVHSHVGALMEMLKSLHLARGLSSEDTSFFYTTTGWMMFNVQVAMLMSGGSVAVYDGSPAWPEPDVLWKLAADVKATGFGASPTYVQLMQQLGVKPREKYDLSAIKYIACTGSPATPETFAWFYENVKENVWIASQSGGTEIVSAFVGASPMLPVHAGEIQTRCLGMSVEAWNDAGEPVVDEVGELICTKPFPSMPLYFLNDDQNARYQDAYFNAFEGVWHHGDFLKINQRGGCYIYGRSDATLNRYGVRIGTSELYRVVEAIPEVADSIVVCLELPGGAFFMPMFVQMKDGAELSQDLKDKISQALRAKCSPRHVPDKYYAVPEIPYTLTGKKVEIPVRKILFQTPLEKAISRDALKNPKAIDFFVEFAATNRDYAL